MCVEPSEPPTRRQLQAARVAGQRVGELDVLAADEPVARHPVGELAGARVSAHAPAPSRTSGRRGDRVRHAVATGVAVASEVGAAHVRPPGDEQLLGREAGDHVAAGRRDDDLLLDPRGRAPVGRGAVGLEREDHALLDLDRVVERVHARDHRRLVEADADAVAELEAEAGLLVGEAELLGGRPDRGDLVGRHARPDERDRRVEPLAALLVRVELRLR